MGSSKTRFFGTTGEPADPADPPSPPLPDILEPPALDPPAQCRSVLKLDIMYCIFFQIAVSIVVCKLPLVFCSLISRGQFSHSEKSISAIFVGKMRIWSQALCENCRAENLCVNCRWYFQFFWARSN